MGSQAVYPRKAGFASHTSTTEPNAHVSAVTVARIFRPARSAFRA